MPPEDTGLASATIWQGYHHAWKYNHRLNRFGSYVRPGLANGQRHTVVGNTAASGTGGDTARFLEHVTQLQVVGVGFQAVAARQPSSASGPRQPLSAKRWIV
ncbi:MAG: hypothetical protein PVH41_15490 [Anaerolineae bacterium]|jgi:hypothetical protein